MLPPSIKLNLSKAWLYGTLVLSSYFDWLLFFLGVTVSLKCGGEKRVLFLGEFLPSRISRIAKYIKRKSDYHTVLIAFKSGAKEKHNVDVFDEVFLFRNKWHLKRLLETIHSTDILHTFGPPCLYPRVAMEAVSNPVFYDLQDTQVINYGFNPPMAYMKSDIPNEQYCFENAAGIISHSLEPQYVKKAYKIKSSPRFHYFPNYCDEDDFKEAQPFSNDEIHIVYAGSVHGRHRNPRHFGNVQFHQKIEELSAQKLHFHIYPSPLQPKSTYEDYYEIAKTNPYFHFHEPVHQEKLAEELSQYHFGFLAIYNGENERQDIKRRYCTSLKLFNYIEAGLPVIISQDLFFQSWITTRYGGSLIIKRKEFPQLYEIISQLDYDKLRKEILLKREQIKLGEHIDKLIRIYNDQSKTQII